MRVIAGTARGRRLKPVPGSGTRPITDRAKSALFSIIGANVVGARFLDLFAGTGSVGIEALSRGASEVVFVEANPTAVRTLRQNLAYTALTAGGRVERANVFDYLTRPPSLFDYVYVAPPQYRGLWADTLRAIDEHPHWLFADGWVVAQIHPREFEALDLETLALFDQRSYGSVMLCFYQLEDD